MQSLARFLTRHWLWTAPVAGGLSAFGFEPWGLWPLTLACLALLVWLTAQAENRRQALFTGWLFGILHFAISLQWIAVAFTYQAAMPQWLGYGGVLLLSLFLAVYPGLAALGAWWIGRIAINTGSTEQPERSEGDSRSAAQAREASFDRLRTSGSMVITFPYILAFAAFWAITEWLRSWILTGFAWNPLAVIALPMQFTGAFGLFGTYGTSILLLLTIGLVLYAAAAQALRQRIFGIGVAALLAIGTFQIENPGEVPEPQAGTPITIVQPNITQEERYDPLQQGSNVQRIAALSPRKTGQDEPRLLFWSESAMPWYLEDGYPPRYYFAQPGGGAAATRRAIAQSLLGDGDILIAGNDRLRHDEKGKLIAAHNSVITMTDDGEIIDWYDKAHLVPFGEYLPYPSLLEPLGIARLVPGDVYFWPGPGPRTLDLGDGRPKAGIQICYEIIFSGRVAEGGNRPDFIFNPSNDAWFGSIGPPQFLAQARLRAVEEGLPIIRATPTGISAVIGPDGEIIENLPLGASGRIDAFLPPPRAPTLFARYGNIIPLALALLMLAMALFPVARARFAR